MWCRLFGCAGPLPTGSLSSTRRSVSYDLSVLATSCKLQSANCTLHSALCKPRATIYEPQATSYKLQATSCELRAVASVQWPMGEKAAEELRQEGGKSNNKFKFIYCAIRTNGQPAHCMLCSRWPFPVGRPNPRLSLKRLAQTNNIGNINRIRAI